MSVAIRVLAAFMRVAGWRKKKGKWVKLGGPRIARSWTGKFWAGFGK